MNLEQELIESLKTTISVQADLIAQLKLEITSLKTSPIFLTPHNPPLGGPQGAYPPNQQPWMPLSPGTPYPHSPFVYEVSGGSAITLKGDSLHLGSIQSQTAGINTATLTTTDFGTFIGQSHNEKTGS